MAISADGAAAKAQVEALPDARDRQAVVRQLNESILPSGDTSRTIIWVVVILGLIAIAIVAMILGFRDEDPAAFVSIATGVVGGIIGLFSKGPTS